MTLWVSISVQRRITQSIRHHMEQLCGVVAAAVYDFSDVTTIEIYNGCEVSTLCNWFVPYNQYSETISVFGFWLHKCEQIAPLRSMPTIACVMLLLLCLTYLSGAAQCWIAVSKSRLLCVLNVLASPFLSNIFWLQRFVAPSLSSSFKQTFRRSWTPSSSSPRIMSDVFCIKSWWRRNLCTLVTLPIATWSRRTFSLTRSAPWRYVMSSCW